jgi:YggT family protein
MTSPLPFPLVHWIVFYGIGFLILSMIVRVIASLFRLDERYAIIRFLARLTDPFIDPVRRIVGRVGVFDISFLIAWFMLITIETLLLQALPSTW